MPSSSRPYQSKLLRFVLAQLQQGLERQRRAWRQVQSTATWGAQLVLLPIYQLLQRASRGGFSFGGGDASPQLEGSEETAVPPEDSPIQRLQGQLQALLLPRQQQLLLAAVESLPTAKPSGPLARWLPGRRAGGALAATSPRSTAIALASSLDNRHLVLVTGSEQMLDILTADQRQQLSARIVQIMAAYWQAQAAAVAGRIYQQLPATVLSVKRAATPPPVVQPEPTPPALKLPRFRRLGRRPLALNQAPTDRQPPALEMAPDAEVEVSPGSVTYIEHPLERVLRWLDRLLTWIERLYHRWFG